ncbi:hypothetical protein [Paenibacillus sp. L3-i20]|uniref:hypothetical protein n=1 Tax=Paenibacillus sp. L3-i20 TaxID=2905833 RepID=UPI001EE149AC|nr:hypothetical protein [Paenibacillus sp. L3-i20]GKU75801.1 hypothetical protein L3i20_v201980 [Paenibacillus sp. L3-i20]
MIVMVSAVFIVFTTALAVLSWKWERARQIVDGVACLAMFVFFIIAATAVLRTVLDGTVFMTEVHSVLTEPAFLASGAYLGTYGVGRTAFIALR